MNRLRFAIIGCGNISLRHAKQIAEKGFLTAVCDVVPEKANALAIRFGATPYYTIEALIKKETVDVICICTPNGLHATHTIQALKAGFHVLCEKPMALTVSDCHKMMQAAASAGKQLFIVKQNRFNPPVLAVKKALDEGKLGRLYSLQVNCFWNRSSAYYQNSWRGSLAMDGGTLYTQFSHFVDLICWMTGDVKQVAAYLKNYMHQGIIEFEDSGVIILEFLNEVIGTINYTVNSFEKNMEGSLTLIAEKGTVKIGGQYLNVLEYQAIENYSIENIPPGNTANQYGTYQGSMSNHDKVYDNLVAVLEGKEKIATSAADGLKTVEVIEKIYLKATRL